MSRFSIFKICSDFIINQIGTFFFENIYFDTVTEVTFVVVDFGVAICVPTAVVACYYSC